MESNVLKKNILIVEDEEAIANLLSYSLKKEGYITKIANNGNEAIVALQNSKPDLVLLDLMLPDINGIDICRIVSNEYLIPIIIVTAKSDITDKVIGLEIGADDYITKPFDIREVVARVKLVLRRFERLGKKVEKIEKEEKKVILKNEIIIYVEQRRVLKDDMDVKLTPKEFELLLLLSENKGVVFSRDKLLEMVWGYDFVGGTRTIDIHIQRLRNKLEENEKKSIIETIFSVGYRMAK